jgi:hypothetical protein
MGKLKDAGAERPPTLEDDLQREAEDRAGMAMGDWLMGRNLNRPISKLTRDELRLMAAVAIGTWVIVRAEQEAISRALPSNESSFLQAG